MRKIYAPISLILLSVFLNIYQINGQDKNGVKNNHEGQECSANLVNGLLTIENSKISRVYNWNEGNIISISSSG